MLKVLLQNSERLEAFVDMLYVVALPVQREVRLHFGPRFTNDGEPRLLLLCHEELAVKPDRLLPNCLLSSRMDDSI